MRTNSTWKVILIAAGPGCLASAALGVIEKFDPRTLLVDLVGAYPVALMAFLPGLPVLAMALVRAVPCATNGATLARVRPGWLALSWIAPWWHVAAIQLTLQTTLFDWRIVAEHSLLVWFVAACGWLCVSRRPRVVRRDIFRGGAAFTRRDQRPPGESADIIQTPSLAAS